MRFSSVLTGTLLTLVAVGCSKGPADADGDGYSVEDGDCNDNDPAAYPSAGDNYGDGADQNCDGTDGVDSDGDGWASEASGGEDCNDSDAESYTGAQDSAGDEIDQNCDGTDGVDSDGDGSASEASGGEDCNDADEEVYPGATDLYGDGADQNCDGTDGVDDDGDGWASSVGGGEDCDDRDPLAYPGAASQEAELCTRDVDGDGYGDSDAANPVEAGSDCDDSDEDAYPGADEYCDGHDDDCDGEVDESDAVDASTWYRDTDSDGYGDASKTEVACVQPWGFVADDTDCDDSDLEEYPGADEYCDGDDDDCDGDIDEDDAIDVATWYEDSDADGYGNESSTDMDCEQPSGYVADSTDCDDSDGDTYPSADEYCDGHDDDCDGDIDEDDSVDVSTWYADADSDGEGDPSTSDLACFRPSGYVANSTDCDDTSAALNTADSDSDGQTTCQSDCDDNDATAYVGVAANEPTLCTHDDDGDGYGDEFATTPLDAGSDCDDADNTAYTGVAANEPTLCTHDDDGDGYGDEFAATPLDAGSDCDDADNTAYAGVAFLEPTLCTHDDDGDGYGDEFATSPLDAGSDCDDVDDTAYTGVASLEPTLCTHDDDGDGYGDEFATSPLDAGSDCDDSEDSVYVGVASNEPTLCTYDLDGDGWGDGSAVSPLDAGLDCDDLDASLNEDDVDNDSYSTCDGDCDDSDASVSTQGSGMNGTCPGDSCLGILNDGDSTGDGLYWIDPDSTGAFQAYCLMDSAYDGGGWTLAMVSSDDGKDTWTWNNRAYMSTDTTTVGSTSALNEDFKSRALNELDFTDLLFLHQPSGVWALYGSVGNGTSDFGRFVDNIGGNVCYGASPSGYAMTGGTLSRIGSLCSTDLFFNPHDQDGGSTCPGAREKTWGPTWSVNNNNGCPLDDPGSVSALGPMYTRPNSECNRPSENCVGFGEKAGLNTGAWGASQNYMQVYVRD